MPGGGQESAPLLQTRDANHEEVCYLHFAVSDVIGITVSGIVVGGFPFRRFRLSRIMRRFCHWRKKLPWSALAGSENLTGLR